MLLGENRQKTAEALTEARNAQQELASLSRQLKRQRLIAKALWKLLSEKLRLTDKELSETVAQIEAAELKQLRVAELCAGCGRSLQDNHPECIYCGQQAARRQEPW
jgi:hypothetical protein